MASEDQLTTGPPPASRPSDEDRRACLQHTLLKNPSGPEALATAPIPTTPTAHHTHSQHPPWRTRPSAKNPPRTTPITLTTTVPTSASADPDLKMDGAALIPERDANLFSIITFQWIQPLLSKGYRRPLVETDLWALDGARDSEHLSALFMKHYERRTLAANKRPSRRRLVLACALSDTFFRQFWSAGLFKLVSDGLTVGSPLVTRALIDYGARVYSSRHGAGPPPSAGHGYALAIGLFLMQLGSAVFLHQFFYRSMSVGVLARSSLIAAIYKRALVLDGRARKQLSPAQLLAHISTDVARIDFCLGYFHLAWTSPIQFIAIMIILINQIGVSSLAGIGLMILLLPLQFKAMGLMFSLRMKVMGWTDQRTRKTQEVLGGMKLLKLFGWEDAFERIITCARSHELGLLRIALIVRAGTMALASSLPLLGAVLGFVTYSATGHGAGDPSAIFTSLSLFNLLRMPLLLLPVALGAITDAANAFKRLDKIFEAGVVEGEVEAGAVVDPTLDCAIRVAAASWVWESEADPAPLHDKAEGATERAASASTVCEEKQRPQFGLADITLDIARGSLTAIVGPVGAGKSSLLQALMGEMKQTDGPPARFGGTIGYCAQTAWIQNASIRANVTFGLPFDEGRYKAVLKAACLEADLVTLPHGDETMIGERGINLSGGQKQRVNIARALYFSPDIILFDDPLSAVDAHVGNALFERAMRATVAIAGGRAQTRVLVTHSLQYLPKVDEIICMEHGRIAERGTFDELVAAGGAFAALYRDFGGGRKEGQAGEVVEAGRTAVVGRNCDLQEGDEKDVIQDKEGIIVDGDGDAKGVTDPANGMQEEERTTGSVGWRVYREYFWAGNGKWTGPILLMSIILQQAGTVLGSYWLVWWQNGEFSGSLGQAGYMGIYAGLGLFQTAAGFMLGAVSVMIGYYASINLYGGALKAVLRAPMSFFDTTPLGRVMNRLSKDMDSIDNTLNDSMRMALTTMSAVIGSIVLIGITSQWFLLAVAATGLVYVLVARFYRPSARDIQRLDNLLRSGLYAHFSESLNGLTTIKAYGMAAQSVAKHCKLLDYENRAYILTVVNQRWLGIRLDGLGALLVLVVALIGVAQAGTLNPSQTGLILSYILGIASSFTWMVRQLAEVENNLNSVERVMWYRDELPQEAPARIPASDPAPTWPSKGAIRAQEIVMCYRPGLPQVLKGLSFEIQAGQKMAVVGRTGAGKSSLMMALFRTTELESGRLFIDGVDISKIGLDRLRQAISIIPQDAVLFEGTIRTNIDPFGEYEDKKLWEALERAGLSGKSQGSGKGEGEGRYGLESVVEDEGQNLSVGERSLVSLARALAKDSQIIVLDEATASVDFETDGKIQETIRKEFKDKTVLCIAHRLRSVIHYDQIMVMDAGRVVEVGSALELFDNLNGDAGGQEQDGIFRGMCLAAGIKREDILCNGPQVMENIDS